MKVFFQLYKRHADIAAAEALAVTQGTNGALIGDELLVADIKKQAFSRLGLSHAAFQFLFACRASEIEKNFSQARWHSEKTFKIIVHHAGPDTLARVSRRVAEKIPDAKASMQHPETEFHFFFLNDGRVIAGKLLWQNTEDFESRKVHRWPAPHPTGTHPQLARAMVNLAGATRTIVDPFCGAGGTLIEAGLMGLKPVGYDISSDLLVKAMKNLQGYGVHNFALGNKDARTLAGKIPHLVADLPYGRNTPPKGLNELYAAFLNCLKAVLTKRAVLGFPSTIDHRPLLRQAKLKILNEFSWEINRKLSKTIVVVQP
jgi:tRNA (guanine10-N2)-dimethyltransferase